MSYRSIENFTNLTPFEMTAPKNSALPYDPESSDTFQDHLNQVGTERAPETRSAQAPVSDSADEITSADEHVSTDENASADDNTSTDGSTATDEKETESQDATNSQSEQSGAEGEDGDTEDEVGTTETAAVIAVAIDESETIPTDEVVAGPTDEDGSTDEPVDPVEAVVTAQEAALVAVNPDGQADSESDDGSEVVTVKHSSEDQESSATREVAVATAVTSEQPEATGGEENSKREARPEPQVTTEQIGNVEVEAEAPTTGDEGALAKSDDAATSNVAEVSGKEIVKSAVVSNEQAKNVQSEEALSDENAADGETGSSKQDNSGTKSASHSKALDATAIAAGADSAGELVIETTEDASGGTQSAATDGDGAVKVVTGGSEEVQATSPGRLTVSRFGVSSQPTTPDGSPTVDQARFVQRVARAFQVGHERGGEIRLRLSPPELGNMRLEIAVKGGVLTARVETETSAARTVLLDNLPALRERLAEQNIKIEQFDVDVRDESSSNSQDKTAADDRPDSNDAGDRSGNSPLPTAEGAEPESSGPPSTVGEGQLNVVV